jgi:hypothetical protein
MHEKNNSNFLQNLGVTDFTNKLNTKDIKHYLHLGGQNYKNLREKVPVLGEDGKPLTFKVGGKTVLQMFKPLFKDGYVPAVGTEHLFARPMKNKTSKRGHGRRSRSRSRSQHGGMDAAGILAWIGVGVYALLQLAPALGNIVPIGSSSSSTSSSSSNLQPQTSPNAI